MDKLQAFSIYDSKVEVWQPPFYGKNKYEAMRSVEQAVNSGDSNLSKYPEDFTLYQVAEFNATNGEMTPLKAINIIKLNELQKKG